MFNKVRLRKTAEGVVRAGAAAAIGSGALWGLYTIDQAVSHARAEQIVDCAAEFKDVPYALGVCQDDANLRRAFLGVVEVIAATGVVYLAGSRAVDGVLQAMYGVDPTTIRPGPLA